MMTMTMKIINTTATTPNFDIKDNFDVDKANLDNDDHDENDQHHGHQAQLRHQRDRG